MSFSNRWPGGSIVTSVAMDWTLGLMYLDSCLNLCSMRITVEYGVIVAVYKLLSTVTILGGGGILVVVGRRGEFMLQGWYH